MNKIKKATFYCYKEPEIPMPCDAEIISVQFINGHPTVFFTTDTKEKRIVYRDFYLLETGDVYEERPDWRLVHIATFNVTDTDYHLFEWIPSRYVTQGNQIFLPDGKKYPRTVSSY